MANEIFQMKKKKLTLIIPILLLTVELLYAQQYKPDKKSLKTLFGCKWTSDYSIMLGGKVPNKDTLTQITFQFKSDQTFILTSHIGKKKMRGTWSYEPKGKKISLYMNGRPTSTILSISDKALTMCLTQQEGLPPDLVGATFFYKPVNR